MLPGMMRPQPSSSVLSAQSWCPLQSAEKGMHPPDRRQRNSVHSVPPPPFSVPWQFSSSSASEQSDSLSQTQDSQMQSPVPIKKYKKENSILPLDNKHEQQIEEQNECQSNCYKSSPLLHWKWFSPQVWLSGAAVVVTAEVEWLVPGHANSSDPSPQSSCPSHFHQSGTQFLLPHSNMVALQLPCEYQVKHTKDNSISLGLKM